MLKTILLSILIMNTMSIAKNIVVVTDTSQGINAKEGMEVMALIDPIKSPLFEDEDTLYGYVFTDKKRLKKIGQYVDKSTSKKGNKDFYNNVFLVYFNTVKSFVQKNKTKQIDMAEKDIVFLIDTSGSMNKPNVENNIKKVLHKTILNKGEKVNIALVTFDGHESFKRGENSNVLLNFTNQLNSINNAIDSIDFSHFNTLLGEGLSTAIELLKERKSKSKMIILLSDGDDIFDNKLALEQIKNAEKNNILVKPFALDDASITTLQQYSSNGKVYDVKSNDFDNLATAPKSKFKNTIFMNLASISNTVLNKNNLKDNLLIIYSPMIEISNLFDFNLIPNLSDDLFYNEVIQKINENKLDIDFNGYKVYIRLTGNPSAQKENELRIFWTRFIKEHNGKLEWINKEDLTFNEMGS